MSRSQEPLPLSESSAITTLAFCAHGDFETVTWVGSNTAIAVEIGRARRRWLEIADMVVDLTTSDEPTAIIRAHRILASLSSGCQVAAVSTGRGCVVSWRDDSLGRFVDVAAMADDFSTTPLVAAAIACYRLTEGKPFPAGQSWAVCVSRSGDIRRLALQTVPLLR